MWAVSDDALLGGVATGDLDAAAAFVERFQRRVFGLAWGIVGDQRVAEEIARGAFLHVWRHASTYDARRGTVASWLLGIVRGLALDHVRVHRPVVIDPEDILAVPRPSEDRAPDESAVLSSEVDRLRDAMGALPIAQRRALARATFYGQTAREIAQSEDIPLGAAQTRLRAALVRLRSALVADGGVS